MTLKQQLQTLIEDAPKYGIAPMVIQKAIAPVLESIARKLPYEEYYLLQNLQEDWLISVIKTNQEPNREKKVIYAFVTFKNAQQFLTVQKADLVAVSLGIIPLLFRVFSLKQIDSIIFVDSATRSNQGVEVKRQDIYYAIQQQLKQLKAVPPDLA